MGLDFGHLYKGIRGIVYYRISPHEQRAFAGAISRGIPNILKNRIFPDILYWLPPFVAGYIIFITGNELHRLSKKKDLSEFEDEVDPNPPQEEEKKCQ